MATARVQCLALDRSNWLGVQMIVSNSSAYGIGCGR
jgi:hypothetical protein